MPKRPSLARPGALFRLMSATPLQLFESYDRLSYIHNCISVLEFQYWNIQYWNSKFDKGLWNMVEWARNGSSGALPRKQGKYMSTPETPEGFKTAEEIAVELRAPISRVQSAVKTLNIMQVTFPSDQRRRYYRPEDVEKIREYVLKKS
jgi:hypothetical protein